MDTQAIANTANDQVTVGSAGIMYGIENIRFKWVDTLQAKKVIED